MGVDPVAKKMSEASADVGIAEPRKGDKFRCQSCGMEIELKSDCHCKAGEHVHFECCGKELSKV
jgi:hypothetical protein